MEIIYVTIQKMQHLHLKKDSKCSEIYTNQSRAKIHMQEKYHCQEVLVR